MTAFGNIRNIEKFMEEFVDWSVLNDALGGGKTPSDIDGVMQRKKEFMFFEKKSYKYASLPVGQRILFEALWKDGNNKTICFIYGNERTPERIEIWAAYGKVFKFDKMHFHSDDALLKVLIEIVRVWYNAANTSQTPNFEPLYAAWERKINDTIAQSIPTNMELALV